VARVFLATAAVALVLAATTSAVPLSRSGSPAPCSLDVRIALVNSFIAAFNAGRVAAADRVIAKKPDFQWFSARGPGERSGPTAENRSTLRQYFQRRHRHHDRLTLVPDWPRTQYFLTRQADDYPRRLVHGKMDAVCRPGQPARIIVWTM
jgi:hypothetical protein